MLDFALVHVHSPCLKPNAKALAQPPTVDIRHTLYPGDLGDIAVDNPAAPTVVRVSIKQSKTEGSATGL